MKNNNAIGLFRAAGSSSDVVRRQRADGEPGASGSGHDDAANAQHPADPAAGARQPRRALLVRRLQQPRPAGARVIRYRQDAA